MGTEISFFVTVQLRRKNRPVAQEVIDSFWEELEEITENSYTGFSSDGDKYWVISTKWWDERETQLKSLSSRYPLLRINVNAVSEDVDIGGCFREIYIEGKVMGYRGYIVYPGYDDFEESDLQ